MLQKWCSTRGCGSSCELVEAEGGFCRSSAGEEKRGNLEQWDRVHLAEEKGRNNEAGYEKKRNVGVFPLARHMVWPLAIYHLVHRHLPIDRLAQDENLHH